MASDRAFTHDIAPPLRDRCCEVELEVPSAEDWTNDFAIPNRIDGRIIGFLNFEPSNLHKVDFKDNQKFVTPRGYERLNTLIKGIKIKDYKTMNLVCQSAIGEGTATKFVAFCKISEKLNIEDYIKHPEKIEKIKEKDVLYFLISALSERYGNKKVTFDTIIKVSKVMEKNKNQEYVALMWRLCLSYNPETFKKEFLNSKDTALIERFGRLIS